MRWHIPHLARSFSTVFKSLESSRLSKTAIHIDSRRLELYSHETKKYITAISHIKCLHVYFSFSFFSFTFLIFSQTRFAESWMTVTWKWCIVCYVIQKTDGVREYSGIIDKNVIHLQFKTTTSYHWHELIQLSHFSLLLFQRFLFCIQLCFKFLQWAPSSTLWIIAR